MKYPILRFLCGSVRFSVRGPFPERFINLAMRCNASLWDIKRDEEGLSACVIANRYKLLKSAAGKTKMKMRLTSKRGLPFILLPYRRRAGFVLGFVFFCLTLWTMSNFIWIVEFPDAGEELSPRIEAAAYEAGIYPGRLRSSMDSQSLATLLELNVSELSWAAVNIFGSRVSIDIREYERYPEKPSLDEPCNLVASKGGVIVEISPAHGFVEVQKGDVVATGDLLVSGVVDDAMGNVSLIHATGKVIARTDYRFTETVPLLQTEPLTTGRVVTIRRLTFLGLEMPLFIGREPEGDFIKTRTESPLRIASCELPVRYIEEHWTEVSDMTHIISERDAVNRAFERIDERISELGDAEVISRTEYIETDINSVTVTVDFTVHQNIAVEENILFD